MPMDLSSKTEQREGGMMKVSEIAPNAKEKNTIGFSVSGAPLYLLKELVKESREYYNDVYWPVLVGWLRDAKAYRELVKSVNQQIIDSQQVADNPIEEPIVPEEKKEEKPKVKLFGGNEGE